MAHPDIGFDPGIGAEITIPFIDIADDAHRCVDWAQSEIVIGVKVPFEGRVIAEIYRRHPCAYSEAGVTYGVVKAALHRWPVGGLGDATEDVVRCERRVG